MLQRLREGRCPQGFHTAGVGGGKVRRDVQRLEMLVEQIEAERINGADGGPLQQHPLAAEGAVARLCLAAPEQCLPDAGPQLGGSRVGKGNDEEAVGVHGVVRVRDEPDGALGQDSGLAAARRRAHQQCTAPVFHGGALGGRPFGFAHAFSSSSVFSSGSKGFSGAFRARSPMPVSWQQIKP